MVLPNTTETIVHDHVYHAFGQYREWKKTAEKALVVAFERAEAIEEQQGTIAKKDRIVTVLTNENDTLRNSETEVLKKINKANNEMEQMRQTHLK